MTSPRELLKVCTVRVAPSIYTLVSLSDTQWRELLSDPALSPRMTAPFMILKDEWEVTLLLDEADFRNVSEALGGAAVKGNFRLISFDIKLDFDVVGFLAEVAKILADSGIPILGLSSFSRDHLLVQQDQLARALVVLGEHVEELC